MRTPTIYAPQATPTHIHVSLLKEEHVGVEQLHQELSLDHGVHGLVGNPPRLLQTLHHTLSVSTLTKKKQRGVKFHTTVTKKAHHIHKKGQSPFTNCTVCPTKHTDFWHLFSIRKPKESMIILEKFSLLKIFLWGSPTMKIKHTNINLQGTFQAIKFSGLP